MAESTAPERKIGRLRKPRKNLASRDALINYVYRLYDGAGDAVYIGRSSQPMKRLREHHATGAEWAPRVVGIDVWGPFNFADVLRLEREAITRERPPGNKDFVLTKTHLPVALP